MRAQGQVSGSIVNISSTYGHERASGASVYVGSKHAVEGITKSVALEIAKLGIRRNGVAPGPTDTGMLTRLPVGRRTRQPWWRRFLWVASAFRRSLPTRSSSLRRTKLHSSPATSSTLMAVTPLGRELINAPSAGLLESALEPRVAFTRRRWHFRKVPILLKNSDRGVCSQYLVAPDFAGERIIHFPRHH